MTNIDPATPATAATPEKNEHGQQTPSVDPQTPQTGPGDTQEGKVTISTKEYGELQRNNARLQAFQKRAQFTSKNNPPQPREAGEGEDPQLVDELRKSQENLNTLQSELHKERVLNKTRELLEKEENKILPKSTRDLILKNPSVLSNANSVEEAMLDIEEFIGEQVVELKTTQPGQSQVPGSSQPTGIPGHETPAVVNPASPAPADQGAIENLDGLTGESKTRAAIRNVLRAKKGGQ